MHFNRRSLFTILIGALLQPTGCERKRVIHPPVTPDLVLGHETPGDPPLQMWLEQFDTRLRNELGMLPADAAAGLLDLQTGRLAMIQPDRTYYAASVAKIGILLAWFAAHPQAATQMDRATEHELGLMIKASSNDSAAKFSRDLGLKNIQATINQLGFYDATRGGGIWVGRHYGGGGDRFGDPIADHSHAVTVRQVLRFYLQLEQGQLLSPQASAAMRRVFDSPDIPHDQIKFVRGLAGQNVNIRRKWGTWEKWRHDSAVVEGSDCYYILVGLTHSVRGDDYLEALSNAVYNQLRRP